MWRIRRMSIFCFYLGVYLHIVNPISTIYCTNPTCQSAGPVRCTSHLTHLFIHRLSLIPLRLCIFPSVLQSFLQKTFTHAHHVLVLSYLFPTSLAIVDITVITDAVGIVRSGDLSQFWGNCRKSCARRHPSAARSRRRLDHVQPQGV